MGSGVNLPWRRSAQQPSAWLVTRDGERVECLLEQVNPTRWQAVPVRDLVMDEVGSAFVSMLPPGYGITFVMAGEEEDDDE